MAFESDLAQSYHATRQRLINGYGAKILDTPIRSTKTPPPDHTGALLKQIEEFTVTIGAFERRVVELQAKVASLESKTLLSPIPKSIVENIISLVMETENISRELLLGGQRQYYIAHARHLGFYLAATCTDRTIAYIGRCFGGKDHTTVMHGRDKIAKMRLADSDLDKRLCWYEQTITTIHRKMQAERNPTLAPSEFVV